MTDLIYIHKDWLWLSDLITVYKRWGWWKKCIPKTNITENKKICYYIYGVSGIFVRYSVLDYYISFYHALWLFFQIVSTGWRFARPLYFDRLLPTDYSGTLIALYTWVSVLTFHRLNILQWPEDWKIQGMRSHFPVCYDILKSTNTEKLSVRRSMLWELMQVSPCRQTGVINPRSYDDTKQLRW